MMPPFHVFLLPRADKTNAVAGLLQTFPLFIFSTELQLRESGGDILSQIEYTKLTPASETRRAKRL